MEELLQKLLEAEILTPETSEELKSAFKTQLSEAIAAAREEAAADVRTQLTEQWIRERDTLIEAIDSKVGEYLETEIEELKEDINRFRDLEAEYAEKLVEAKASMSNELKNDLKELVEKLDAFLEIRLSAEIEELREDIEEVRKNEFGRRVFEAFAQEYVQGYADKDSAHASLREVQSRLEDVEQALQESERKRATIERKVKMDKVLSPLSGRQREVMEAILRNVDTENLDEGYKTFIGRVLRETTSSEKEETVLAESVNKEKVEKKGVTKTGDTATTITESEDKQAKGATNNLDYYRKLAGIK